MGPPSVMSATRSVRVSPGRIALTRMLLAPSSSAANCTRWSTPDFETPYAPNQRCVLLLAIDEIATMDPPPPATSARAPCLIVSRSEEHTSELQSLMRISYAVFCLKKKKHIAHILSQHKP